MIEFTHLLAGIDAAKKRRVVLWQELEAQKKKELEIGSELDQLRALKE